MGPRVDYIQSPKNTIYVYFETPITFNTVRLWALDLDLTTAHDPKGTDVSFRT